MCEIHQESNAGFWKIPKPAIIPFNQRIKEPSKEYLIEQLKNYPTSYYENAYSNRPAFNGSLWGYFMAVMGGRQTVEVIRDNRQVTKVIEKKGNYTEVSYYPLHYNTLADVPTVENFVSNKKQVLKGREHRINGNNIGYKKAKSLSIAISGSAVYPENAPNKKESNIAYRNHTLFLDLDLETTDDLEGIYEKIKQDPYTLIVHRSFSGDGFVVIVEMSEIDANENFFLVFKKIEKYYKSTFNLNIDPSCKNIGRLRYVSYDPDIFIKENILIEITKEELENIEQERSILVKKSTEKVAIIEQKRKVNPKSFKSVSDLVDEIITTENRLTEGYHNWVQIAFSLHEYQDQWDRLNQWRNDESYHTSLNSANLKGSSATIGTFYYFCKKAGISIKQELTKTQNNEYVQSTENHSSILVEPLNNTLETIKKEISKYKRNEAEELSGFLSDKLDELQHSWSSSHINILESPASSGKTSMVVKLSEMGNRCLLIVPTKAIIKNKRLKDFLTVYENINIREFLNSTKSIICTFDKASRLKTPDFESFDYIFIDESHLLFTEAYRRNTMVLLLKKIKNLIMNKRNE